MFNHIHTQLEHMSIVKQHRLARDVMKPASARTQNRSTYRMTDQHIRRWGKRENILAMLDIPCFDNIHDTAFPAGQQLDTVTVAGVASSPAGTGVHSSTAGVYSVYIQYSGCRCVELVYTSNERAHAHQQFTNHTTASRPPFCSSCRC